MVGDPRDRTAYCVAIAGLGLAVVALVIVIGWTATHQPDLTETFTHKCALGVSAHCRPPVYSHIAPTEAEIPDGLWAALAVLGGILVGALIPLPLPTLPPRVGLKPPKWDIALSIFVGAIFVIAAALFLFASLDSLAQLAFAGLLLGLLVPSPARRE